MAERRTKVYRGLQEQQRDEADAIAHGWTVVSRDSEPGGYRVTYELGSAWAETTLPSEPRGPRKATWLFILWNLAFAVLALVRVATGGYVGDTWEQTLRSITESGLLMGLGLVWFVGLVVISIIWLRSRRRD